MENSVRGTTDFPMSSKISFAKPFCNAWVEKRLVVTSNLGLPNPQPDPSPDPFPHPKPPLPNPKPPLPDPPPQPVPPIPHVGGN